MGKETSSRGYQSSSKFIYYNFIPFILFHGLAIVGILFVPPDKSTLILLVIMILVPGLSITLCYHRCLTHRAFEFKHKWLERLFATFGVLALEKGPIWWGSIHRLHHKYSDTDQDPHNSNRGFLFSHFLWFAHLDPRWTNRYRIENYEGVVKDLAEDPYYRILDKYYLDLFLVLFLWIGFYFIGGWPWFFWGGPIATLYVWHTTFLVNSWTHEWGFTSYNTNDNSRNNPIVGILANGEGWHNNHHAFPSSAKNGFFKWWEFDLTYLIILLMKHLGLVHKVIIPSKDKIQSRRLKYEPVLEKQKLEIKTQL